MTSCPPHAIVLAKAWVPIVSKPPKKGPTFTKTFLPKGYYLSCGVENQAFLAPMQFKIKQIEATGKANGLNPFAVNANVGHYGTFDYQRSRDSAGNTTFYSGFKLAGSSIHPSSP